MEQQVLKRNNYNKTALRKTVVHPLRSLTPKQKPKRKQVAEKEKQILTSLVYSQIKQREGQSTQTLVGIGMAEKPPLFFNPDGTPCTNVNKSMYRTAILKRYGENDFHNEADSVEFMEERAVLVDGMPILFLRPIMGLTTFAAYVHFILNKKIFAHFGKADEVHVAFDVPNIWGFNLKKNVQKKRDSKSIPLPTKKWTITDETEIPGSSKWPSFLADRAAKRELVLYIGHKLLEAKADIPEGKSVIVGGCFPDNKTRILTRGDEQVLPDLECNHEEADTRIFAHAMWSKKQILEIVAADTDIFAIFLLNQENFCDKQVILDTGEGKGNLDMSKLTKRMNEDPDTNLARLRTQGVSSSSVFGLIHCLLGTDILCSPRGFGPTWIIKACLDYCTYIFNQQHGIQLLWKEDPQSRGSYIRFIVALFKKKFASRIKKSPEDLLHPLSDYGDLIKEIQEETWAYTLESKSMLPSQECLHLRELNLTFQLKVWMQATKPMIIIEDPKQYGWEEVDGEYQLVADSSENLKKQKTIFDTIMRKCGCKTSQCLTGRCTCKKNNTHCTSLCGCLNCENSGEKAPTPDESQVVADQDVYSLEIDEDDVSSASEAESENEADSDLDME